MDELVKLFLHGTTDAAGSGHFLVRLWKLWRGDVPQAVLLARWYWQDLPEELVQQAEEIRRQAKAAAEQTIFAQQMGVPAKSAGASPSGGNCVGPEMDAEQVMFLATMSTIRAHNGEPPTAPEMVDMAEKVLTGKMDPVEAMLATASEAVRQQLKLAMQLGEMLGISQVLRVQGLMQAAFSLPRKLIPLLLPDATPAKADGER